MLGGSGGIIFHMFSATLTHQNAFKAILSIFRHFFFPLENSICFLHLLFESFPN